MHAVGYRPRLIVVVLVTLCLGGVVALRSSEPSRPRHGCSHALSASESRVVADRLYRQARFGDAEHVIRVVAERQPEALRQEFHVIASFYHQLGDSYALAMAPVTRATLSQIELTLQLDAMLGGAFQDELVARRQQAVATLGPM